MAIATAVFNFDAGLQGWVAQTNGSPTTLSYDSVNACLRADTKGRNLRANSEWILSGTFSSIFGVVGTAVIDSLFVPGDGYKRKCIAYNVGVGSEDGDLFIKLTNFTSGNILSCVPQAIINAVDVNWVSRDCINFNQTFGSNPFTGIEPIELHLVADCNTGANKNAEVTLLQDSIIMSVNYH